MAKTKLHAQNYRTCFIVRVHMYHERTTELRMFLLSLISRLIWNGLNRCFFSKCWCTNLRKLLFSFSFLEPKVILLCVLFCPIQRVKPNVSLNVRKSKAVRHQKCWKFGQFSVVSPTVSTLHWCMMTMGNHFILTVLKHTHTKVCLANTAVS